MSVVAETGGATRRQVARPQRDDQIAVAHPFYVLLSISKSVRALTSLSVEEIGLNVGQDQFLSAVQPGKETSVSELCTTLNVRPSTVSKMADCLTEKGLVERAKCGGDARRTIILLTESGVAKRDEVHAVWDRLHDGLAKADSVLDDPDARAALTTIDTVLRKRLARLR